MAASKKPSAPKTVRFKLAILGQVPTTKSAKAGVTIAHLRAKYTLEGLSVKVNGSTASDSYAIKNGDSIVVVTSVKSGQ